MLTIWTYKIKISTLGASFSVTFSVPPTELEYLNKLYESFNSLNMRSFPIAADRKTEPQQKSCATCEHALGDWDGESDNCGRCCGEDRRFYEPIEYEPQTNGYQTFNGTSVYVSRLEDEPQTDEEWYTFRDEQEYSDRWERRE